jgi:hypothetical protein
VRIVASAEALALARERGGRLYVWPKARRCCHGTQTWLELDHDPPSATDFERATLGEVDVYFPTSLARRPEELHLEVHGLRSKRVAAYWDGCAWVM